MTEICLFLVPIFFSKIAKKFHPFKNIFVVFIYLIGTKKKEREVVRERKRGKEERKELEREGRKEREEKREKVLWVNGPVPGEDIEKKKKELLLLRQREREREGERG